MKRIQMNRRQNTNRRGMQRRKGAAIILAVFLLGVLVSMLALAIDIGYIAASKAEARRTTDASALAGCWQIYESISKNVDESTLSDDVEEVVSDLATLNKVCNGSPSFSNCGQDADIRLGYLASLDENAPLESSSSNPYRAIRVRLRKTEALNGRVPLFFARVFGQTGRNMTVESTAAMASQIKGFGTPSSGSGNIDLLPFAIDVDTWDAMLAGGGTDSYRFDASRYEVLPGSDGVREVNLYPQGTGSPGNRGTVDIGGSNNSTADIARQILYGISAADMTNLGKPLSLGGTGTMTLNGDTGISAGVKDELASIIGKTRIIPVFSSVSGNGNNAMYTIVRWVGVRILDVKLTGSMSSKYLRIQPATVVARNIIPGDSTRSWSNSIYSPVVLVK
ncbi:MAG: pilus assembly protein TadG-related protein [Pirellula sp.]